MCKALMNANLRVNEFKLRQQELSRTSIPNDLKPKVRELMKKGSAKRQSSWCLVAVMTT